MKSGEHEHRREQYEAKRRDFDVIIKLIRRRNPRVMEEIERSGLFHHVNILCWQSFYAGIEVARRGSPKGVFPKP